MSSQVEYSLQAIWGVSIRELHLALWKPWSTLRDASLNGTLLEGHAQYYTPPQTYPLFIRSIWVSRFSIFNVKYIQFLTFPQVGESMIEHSVTRSIGSIETCRISNHLRNRPRIKPSIIDSNNSEWNNIEKFRSVFSTRFSMTEIGKLALMLPHSVGNYNAGANLPIQHVPNI